MFIDDTIAAIATAPGEGGIGIIRISGEKSLQVAQSIFKSKSGKMIKDYNARTLIYGTVVDNEKVIDEVLVAYMKGPNSYTAEDVIEINCHGGFISVKKILELIADNNIGTQEELADALNKAGYNVTQATVSRGIRALNLTKVTIDGVNQKYTTLSHSSPVPNDKYIRVLKEGYLSMDMAQNILVIRTVPGMAMAVCAALDALKLDEIVGSIAGDDTIMCAVRTVKDTVNVSNKLKKLIKA